MSFRADILRAIAQSTDSSGISSKTISQQSRVTPISIRNVPRFNQALFNAKPIVINDLDKIANLLNSYLSQWSGGQITFATTYTSSSELASNFSASVRSFLKVSKWLYSVITYQGQEYTIAGLNKLGNDLITTVRNTPFPDPGASEVQAKIVATAQEMLQKISA